MNCINKWWKSDHVVRKNNRTHPHLPFAILRKHLWARILHHNSLASYYIVTIERNDKSSLQPPLQLSPLPTMSNLIHCKQEVNQPIGHRRYMQKTLLQRKPFFLLYCFGNSSSDKRNEEYGKGWKKERCRTDVGISFTDELSDAAARRCARTELNNEVCIYSPYHTKYGISYFRDLDSSQPFLRWFIFVYNFSLWRLEDLQIIKFLIID